MSSGESRTPSIPNRCHIGVRNSAASVGMSSRRSPSGGNHQFDDREPVVQVLPEAARPRIGRKVAVGDRDHAHVHLFDTPGAHRLDLALLQRAQQLGLDRERQLAHLVEHQRPAMRLAEEPGRAWVAPVKARARGRTAPPRPDRRESLRS